MNFWTLQAEVPIYEASAAREAVEDILVEKAIAYFLNNSTQRTFLQKIQLGETGPYIGEKISVTLV